MVGQVESNQAKAPPTSPLTKDQVEAMLHRADIILTHGSDPVARVIRLVTHSYWNHVAVVALLADAEQGYQHTFILEAEANRGIDIHPVGKYFDDDKSQDLAILRFPDAALGSGCAVEFLRRVRGFALEEIDAEYGHRAIVGILAKAVRPLRWVLGPIIRAMKLAASILRLINGNKTVNDFICSGVVQYAYYRACYRTNPKKVEFWDDFFKEVKNRENLIVNPDIRSAIDFGAAPKAVEEQLKLTVPGDFSRAAADGLLQCVAQRIKGKWRVEQAKP